VKGLSTRAEPLTASGQNCWPPTGSYVTAYGQDLMAADTFVRHLYPTTTGGEEVGGLSSAWLDLIPRVPTAVSSGDEAFRRSMGSSWKTMPGCLLPTFG
jgi:hypothetical protein